MAANTFIKFEGGVATEGESKDATHAGEIEILSWQNGSSQPAGSVRSTAGAATTAKVSHQDFTFSKFFDKSSTALLTSIWSGDVYTKVTVMQYRDAGKGNRVPFMEIVMEDVVISSLSISGAGDSLPIESISLNFGTIQYNQTSQDQKSGDKKGQTSAKHDLEKNVLA